MRKLLVTICLLFCSTAFAQTGAFGAPLGKLPVGYRMEWVADQTRSWAVFDPAAGRLIATPRWVRVHMWYPSLAGTGTAMTLRDYFQAPRPPQVPEAIEQAIYGNDFGSPTYSFRGMFREDEPRLQHSLSTAMAARSGAEPSAGRFPVVVYSVGQNDFTQDAVLLAEYLASEGFIVVTVPHLGTNPRRRMLFVNDPYSYETQLRDLELALTQKALKLRSADPARIVAVGHSYGGIYALLLAMRNHEVKAVIGLDPTYIAKRASYEYDLRKFPFFDVNLRAPVITLRRGSQTMDRSLVDSLRRSERLEIAYPELMHGDFTSVAFFKRELPDSLQLADELKVRSTQTAGQGATQVFLQVAAMLQRVLSDQSALGGVISGPGVRQEVMRTAAVDAPTEEEVYWIYKAKGMEAAKRAISDAREQAGATPVLQESAFLTISRELGYFGKDAESADLFRLTAFAFPGSVSAQLAAAEGLADSGARDEARLLYERVLGLDPSNQAAKDALSKLPKTQ